MNPIQSFRLTRHLVLLGIFATSGLAHASTITYNLIGVSTSAGTVTGTVTINSTTDLVTAANITFNDTAAGDPVFTNIGSPNTYNGLGQDYISGTSDSPLNWGGQIALYYDTANIGTGDLSLCLAVGPCGTEFNQASYVQAYVNNGLGGPFNITNGSLDPTEFANNLPASPTVPEPASLFLLGTGIVAIAAVMARFSARKPEPDLVLPPMAQAEPAID